MTPESVEEALYERVTEERLEDVVTKLASAVVLLSSMVVNLGGTPTTATTVVEFCTEAVEKTRRG